MSVEPGSCEAVTSRLGERWTNCSKYLKKCVGQSIVLRIRTRIRKRIRTFMCIDLRKDAFTAYVYLHTLFT